MVFILFGVLWTCWIWIFLFLIINGRFFSLLHTSFPFAILIALWCVSTILCAPLLSLWISLSPLYLASSLGFSFTDSLFVRCHDEPCEVILHCCCCDFIFSISIWHLDFLTPCWNASSVLLLCLLFPWELLMFVIITLNSYLESWRVIPESIPIACFLVVFFCGN